MITWDGEADFVADRRTTRLRRAADRRVYWQVWGAGVLAGTLVGFFGALLLL